MATKKKASVVKEIPKPAVETPPEPAPTIQTPPATPVKKSSSKTILLVLLGLLLLCCICSVIGGLFYYFSNKSTTNLPPIVNILEPTGSNWFTASTEEISLSGIASDDSGSVSKISWEVEGGGSGKAQGSTNWSIDSITLKEGDNKVTITAQDSSGKQSTDKIVITYNPGVDLSSSLKMTPDYIFKDDPAVSFTAQLKVIKSVGQTISSVTLFEVDENGEMVSEIGEMVDDGVVESGDDIPGDSNYGYKGQFSTNTDAPKYFRAIVAVEGSQSPAMSSVTKVLSIAHASQTTMQQINDLNQAVSDLTTQLQNQGQTPQQIASAVNTFVGQRPGINSSGVSQNGTGVWWIYENTCIPGGTLITEPGVKGGTLSGEASLVSQIIQPTYAQSDTETKVDSTKAIYLGPYLSYFGASDDYYGAWQKIKESQCPQCQTVEKTDSAVMVEDFKGLDQYGLVVISSHGDNWYGGLSGDNMCASGFEQSQVIIYTAEKLTNENLATYEADLMSKRLAVGVDDNLIILPGYIEHYNSSFPNSLVYVSACRSSYNTTMAAAFLGSGAKAYYGYDDYVSSGYALNAGQELFSSFVLNSDTASEAFQSAVSTAGPNDGNGADFLWIGQDDLKMGGRVLRNVSFETSDLNGWANIGDARIISSLGPITPTDGSYMSIISTGLGSVSDSNTSIEQSICYNGGNATLTFDYNLVSEEPMEYIGTEYDDKLEVLVSINGSASTILSAGVNNSTWSPISGIDFSGGDSTTYTTGWKTFSYPLTGVTAGSQVVVTFRVSDVGDSNYDTAALIDNIGVN